MMQLGGLKGDGKGGVKVQPDEIRRTMESVRDATANPEVRRIMVKALEAYSKQPRTVQEFHPGLASAASVLLEEMAATKRAERIVLWLGPALTLIATGLLFLVLRTFISGL